MSANIKYWSSIMTEDYATSITEAFLTILRSAITAPDQSISNMNKVGSLDTASIALWNQTSAVQVNRCLHHIIESQVAANPAADAVCAWDGNLTYAQLDDLSSRIARHLNNVGVGPEICVLVCLERSLWAPVALLAVLKAGGAFVPLDPKLPQKRIEELARRVRATIALTDKTTSAHVATSVQTTLELSEESFTWMPATGDSPSSLEAAASAASSAVPVQPSNAAYIIFTSGSTGVPKGVTIEHSTLSSSALAQASAMRLGPHSRAYHFTSLAFDPSLTELLVTLTQGGCVCVPSEAQRLSSTTVTMNDLQVNWAFFTPSVAATLRPRDVPRLKTLVLGGEAMMAKNVEEWAGEVELINGYGPTESCIFCVSTKMEPKSANASLIGRAIGSTAWISDPDSPGTLVPVGAIGELLIQGPIVARGYLDDDQLSAKMFLPATTMPSIGQADTAHRVYRTGDMVRYRPDGSIEYMGRKDSQVKLRGQRIELEEISHTILSLWPEAERAVTEVVRPSDTGNPMLVTFIHARKPGSVVDQIRPEDEQQQQQQPDWLAQAWPTFLERASLLLTQLTEVLPRYMIPQAVIPVHWMPVSLSGKVERGKLRDWAAMLGAEKLAAYGQAARTARRKPTTDAEVRLQGLWEEVLQLPAGSVSAEDNFFTLGADSIRVMSLVFAARRIGLSATVTDVMTNPVLERMTELFIPIEETTTVEEVSEAEVKAFELFGDADELADILALN